MLYVVLGIDAQYRNIKLPNTPKQTNYRNYLSEDTGFWCAFDLEGGSSVMVHHTNMQYVNLGWAGGYRINEFIRLGIGTGVRYYINNADVRYSDNKFGIPIFANARGNFISAYDRDGVPFWSLNIGGITNDGFFASPTIGYSFGGLRNNFQIGISYTITSFRNYNKKDMAYSYFGVKVGYEF
jgi:hypothetical protein